MSSHLFTYAVGDVHGDHALLTTLLDRIHDHADGEDYRLVFLGNAIDHGPNGAAVLSALRSMELRAPDRVVALRGWHEAMMAEAERDPEALALWLRHGGDATLRSFQAKRLQDVPREVADWVARRPAEWRDALRRYVGGPELAEDGATPGLHVVHGALPVRPTGDRMLPEGRSGVTCIDTGAGFGGPLTAAVFTDLQPEPVGFFQAQEDGRCLFIPPRQSAPLGRDPRLALRHADGEPETAADWSIRQDAEHIEARLAAKRRQAQRRKLMASAAGLVLLAGGGAVLWKPALQYVSAPSSVRWPLAVDESARAPLGGSDMASLAPQLPDSQGQTAVAPGEAIAPATPPATPQQADAVAPPADAAPFAPEAADSASAAAEPGPQRAHALPPLPDPRAPDPAPAGVASVSPEASPPPSGPDDGTADATLAPPLMAHALPTPETAPTPPAGHDVAAISSAPPSLSLPESAAAPTQPEPAPNAAPPAGEAASPPSAPESDAARVAEAEPPLAPLLPSQAKPTETPQAQTLPAPSAGETAATQAQATSEPPVTAAAPRAEQPAAVANAPAAVSEAAPGDLAPRGDAVAAATPDAPAAAPAEPMTAAPARPGLPDAETTAAFNTPATEPPSAPPAQAAEAPAAERTETAMLPPAAPVEPAPESQAPAASGPLASSSAVPEAAAPQPPLFVLATSFTLASPLSTQPGWRAVVTSPDAESARPRAAFAALPAMSTPDLLDDAAPPFVASMPATTGTSAQPAEAATPKPAARLPAKASAPSALRRPPARVAAPAARPEPAQASQAAGPIDLRSQQPKPPASRGRLPAPSPASGQLY